MASETASAIVSENDLIAFRTGSMPGMKLVPSPPGRGWMNRTEESFANRCLPMRIASQAGWMILNDRPTRARWLGGAAAASTQIECEGHAPFSAVSHFGYGILTFVVPFLFRTPPGVSLLFRGPANLPKDAIAPLEAIVETEWAVAAASVNWQFTRENVWVEFGADEPICMIVPQRLGHLEAITPRVLPIGEQQETLRAYQAWNESCTAFTRKLREREPETVKQGWQRFYFEGSAPHAGGQPLVDESVHRRRLALRSFEGQEKADADVSGTASEATRKAEAQRRLEHLSPTLAAMDGCPWRPPKD